MGTTPPPCAPGACGVLTDVTGVLVGHWTDQSARTGCTVVLLPRGNVCSGEIRGGAPGTREFALLDPTRMVTGVDAVVLTGGSAFGLAACDGVMRWCSENGRGFATRFGNVPIVVGAVIYDLSIAAAGVRPTEASGYAACSVASSGPHEVGLVGAGIGATRSKWRGNDHVLHGGLGAATVCSGDVIVSALMVVNPIGDIVMDGPIPFDDVTSIVPAFRSLAAASAASDVGENTTIGVVVTNARLDKLGCHLVAQSGHDGIARSVWPAHLTGDGDAIIAACVPTVEAPLDAVRALAAEAVAMAIRNVGARGPSEIQLRR